MPFTPTHAQARGKRLTHHAQVGDVAVERTLWRRPEDITAKQEIDYVRASDSPADLAGQMVAALAGGAVAMFRHGAAEVPLVDTYLKRAHRLLSSVMLSPAPYQMASNFTANALAAMYPSNTYLDDLMWGASWMLRATQNGFRSENASYYYAATRTTFELGFAQRDNMAVSGDWIANTALIHAASITQARTKLPPPPFFLCGGNSRLVCCCMARSPSNKISVQGLAVDTLR